MQQLHVAPQIDQEGMNLEPVLLYFAVPVLFIYPAVYPGRKHFGKKGMSFLFFVRRIKISIDQKSFISAAVAMLDDIHIPDIVQGHRNTYMIVKASFPCHEPAIVPQLLPVEQIPVLAVCKRAKGSACQGKIVVPVGQVIELQETKQVIR